MNLDKHLDEERRCFTPKQKEALYLGFGGICQHCFDPLDDTWEAHHIRPFARGGETELNNGIPVHKHCHVRIHEEIRKCMKQKMTPRGWQHEALQKFLAAMKKFFLIEACMGAGKTIFAAFIADALMQAGHVNFVVIVECLNSVKGDEKTGRTGVIGDFWQACGLRIKSELKKGRGPKSGKFSGAVITYHSLASIVPTLELWAKNGMKLLVVFDEVHHASDFNEWGRQAEKLSDIATYVLSMTGTPFRGDRRRIKFIDYSQDGSAVPDYTYSYRHAVRDQVCRAVTFKMLDGEAKWMKNGIHYKARISDASDDDVRSITKTIFGGNSEFLREMARDADSALGGCREEFPDAKGVVICKPGNETPDESDKRFLHRVARLVEGVVGEKPVVVSCDDDKAVDLIAAFGESKNPRWIASVRMLSEGVNIPQLQVLILACSTDSELLFRQLIGRVFRVRNKENPEEAIVYMAKLPGLVEFARNIEEEAKAGLRDRDQKRERRNGTNGAVGAEDFLSISSKAEEGGAYYRGEYYSPEEIAEAEKEIARNPRLRGMNPAQAAEFRRQWLADNSSSHSTDVTAEARLSVVLDSDTNPFVEETELRQEFNHEARRAAERINSQNPDYQGIYSYIYGQVGVDDLNDLIENHDAALARHAIKLLRSVSPKGRRANER